MAPRGQQASLPRLLRQQCGKEDQQTTEHLVTYAVGMGGVEGKLSGDTGEIDVVSVWSAGLDQ